MDLSQRLKGELQKYATDEFHIDEHAMKRCQDYIELDLDEVLYRLKNAKFSKVVKNDSKQEELSQYDSYKVRVPKSSNYVYEIVIYMTEDKPLIKTVSKLNSSAQEMIDNA